MGKRAELRERRKKQRRRLVIAGGTAFALLVVAVTVLLVKSSGSGGTHNNKPVRTQRTLLFQVKAVDGTAISSALMAEDPKAGSGAIPNFTGIDSPYEPPEDPEVRLTTVDHEPESLADLLVAELRRQGILG